MHWVITMMLNLYAGDFGVCLSTILCKTCYFVIALDLHTADVTFIIGARRARREIYNVFLCNLLHYHCDLHTSSINFFGTGVIYYTGWLTKHAHLYLFLSWWIYSNPKILEFLNILWQFFKTFEFVFTTYHDEECHVSYKLLFFKWETPFLL